MRVSQKGSEVSQKQAGNVRDRTRARVKGMGHLSRPTSCPGTTVPCPKTDRRFDGWLSGATAEQQAAWEAGKKPGKP